MRVGEENGIDNGIRGFVGPERIDRDLSRLERGNAEFCLTARSWYICMYAVTAFA